MRSARFAMQCLLVWMCLSQKGFGGMDIPYKVLCEKPRVYLIENFLSHSECDHIIVAAHAQLSRSTVVDSKSSAGVIDDVRTSRGMFFPQFPQDPILQRIEKRIAKLTKIPIENGEGLQVLHYGVGGEYKPHYDFFDSKTQGGAAHLSRGGQRIATLIMYLRNTEEGGETIFPYPNIRVKPTKGNAILFYNCLPNGQEDGLSLHGGAPVIRGEKWIATKWLRVGVFR